jgi:hypothetical protein
MKHGHPNQEGHNLIANEFLRKLKYKLKIWFFKYKKEKPDTYIYEEER